MARVRLVALMAAAALTLGFGFGSASAADKVEVDHKGKRVLCVSVNAAAAHMAHGDTVGDPC